MSTLLRSVEVEGALCDVRLKDGRVAEIAPSLGAGGEDELIDGAQGALIPGLHDHHLHLLAMAAIKHSLNLRKVKDLRAAFKGFPSSGWVRAIGYSQSEHPPLDRDKLDAIETRPTRVQHSGGSLWILNSAAISALSLDSIRCDGLERDGNGRLTGRLWRLDTFLAGRLAAIGESGLPDLAAVGSELMSYGITGVTDATPELSDDSVSHLSTLPQGLHLLRDSKIIISDHDLPDLDELCQRIAALHARQQIAAVHCVTREAIALLLAAFNEVGAIPGDRVEHGALIDDDAAKQLSAMGVSVVTQPGFITDRGDRYLRELPTTDHADLYRFGGLLRCDVNTVAASDAPFGPLDPWLIIAAAQSRPLESVPAATTLDGMLRPLHDLHAPARRVAIGTPAQLVLLHSPLVEALRIPSADFVRQVWL